MNQRPFLSLEAATRLSISKPASLKYHLLVKPFTPFHDPSACENIPGVFSVPWTNLERRYGECQLTIEGLNVYPANAFTHHQSQGSILGRSVVLINEKSTRYLMSNVVFSRTPDPSKLALLKPITLETVQPVPEASVAVEREYNRLTHLSANK